MSINFNVSPYYDDYDETKGFYRILFKPGVSVQARELTQLQTAIQKQVERLGSHFFKEGSRVLGGNFGYTREFDAVKLGSNFNGVKVDDYIDQLDGIEIFGETSGVRATVVAHSKSTDTDPPTIYVTYTQTGYDKVSTTFSSSENIIAEDSTINSIAAGLPIITTDAVDHVAKGQSANIEEGVYFVAGHFVYTEAQRVIISKYTNTESCRIGMLVNEVIITASDDESLLDNAQGSPNFSARGADRYAIDLELTFLDLDADAPENFIEFQRVQNGRQLQANDSVTNPFSEFDRRLARRTEESEGDYVVDSFDVNIRETLNDGINNGVYQSGVTTDSGNTADESLMTLQVSSGTAYVSGFRVETIAPTFVDISKPRQTREVTNAVSTADIGNFVRINNLYNTPDISGESAQGITAFKNVDLYDTFNTVPGTANGQKIGVARIRGLEFDSGDQGAFVDAFDSAATFRSFLFDIKMFTQVTVGVAAEATHIAQGAKIKGKTSKATGYVNSLSSGTELFLTSVTGSFIVGEELESTASYATGNTITQSDLTTPVVTTAVVSNAFDAVKQIYMDDPDAGEDFTCDVALESRFTLSGTANISTTAITGLNTSFTQELRVGDQILVPTGTDGALETRFVTVITSDNVVTVDSAVTNAVSSVPIIRARAFINDQDSNVAVRKLAKDFISTLKTTTNGGLSQTSVEVRKQFIGTTSTDGTVTFNIGANQTFNTESNLDYQVSVLQAGVGGSAVAGDVINVAGSNIAITGDGTNALTLDSASLFGNGATIKLNATIRKTGQEAKTKTPVRSAKTKVLNKSQYTSGDGAMVYGTSAHHDEISLGVCDAYKVLAVYDSGAIGVDPVIPSLTVSSQIGTFTPGERIIGQTTGAIGTAGTNVSPIEYVSFNGIGFEAGETILGEESGATATIDSLTAGSTNITDNFVLDTGMRDNFYDVSRIVFKPKANRPAGDIVVVYNYFTHGTGDFFTVDSYAAVDYKDIPSYSATRIDPEIREIIGLYDLRSSIDFRPRVANPTQTTDAGRIVVTGTSFDFDSRQYTGAGSSKVDFIKDNSNIEYDFEFYLAKNSSLYLTATGVFKVVDGYDSEKPENPSDLAEAMKIADITMPAYVLDIDDVGIDLFNTRRYSMKDIALLEDRIKNIEYYTSLSLLEKDASDLQVKDAFGLDRFKSGFLVDNFGGHKIGDTANQDYRCAIDMESRVLRPKFNMKSIALVEKALDDAERLAAGYVNKDNMVMLPYTHEVTIQQNFSSRVENLNPVLSFFWEGSMTLSPSSDEWFETRQLPNVIINVEGNYNTLLRRNRNALGTVWDAPVTNWSGRVRGVRGRAFRSFRRSRVRGRAVLQRVSFTETGTQRRSGVQTSIVEQIDYKELSNRIVATSLIPFMRSKEIFFQASGLKPFMQVYPFFDKVDVSRYCQQTSGSFKAVDGATTTTTQVAGWNQISKVEIYYDLNVNDSATIQVQFARDLDASRGVTNPTEYWVDFGLQTTSSVATGSQGFDLMTFTDTVPNWVSPNEKGELFFRILVSDADGKATRGFQISEIRFYDENDTLIDNVTRVECIFTRNFANGQNVCDGTVNTNSNRSGVSEATIGSRNAPGRVHQIGLRIVGGSFTQSAVVPFIQSSDLEPGTFITDGSGYVSGFFTIPDPNVSGNPKFETGSREFRLTASPTNSDVTETFAIAEYSAKGVLQSRERRIQATRNARIVRQRVSSTTTVSRSRGSTLVEVGWWDPLAQSIMPSTEGGEFISKVDVYFSQKDGKIPVTMQLRLMENGTPTTTVIPGGEVTLDPEDVNVSGDGSVATTFEFPFPVYVKQDEEIAIVLFSNSLKYLAWISRLGETDSVTGKTISEQPYLGVLFKSQNQSTWTAYDLEDLKFKVYRAKFDTTTTGVVELNNADIPAEDLVSNPIVATAGSTTLKVNHQDHGMYGASNVVDISGVTSGISSVLDVDLEAAGTSLTITDATGFPTSGNVTLLIKTANPEEATNEVVTGTAALSGQNLIVSSLVRQVEGTAGFHPAGSVVEFYEFNGIPLNEINGQHTVANQGLDYYTIETTTPATEDAVMGGNSVFATHNAVIDSYQLMVPTIPYPDTELGVTTQFLSATSPSGTQASFVPGIVEDAIVTERLDNDTPEMIASLPNEVANYSSNRSARIIFTMSTSKDNLSPVIDLERKSITTYMNRIDNIQSSADVYPASSYVEPTAPEGDSLETIYITKRVQLKNPATSLKVLLDAVRNASANIEVMYKVLRSDDSTDFDEIGWTYFNTDGSPDSEISAVSDRESLIEYEYTEDEITEFIAFAIKIRMLGTDGTEVPLVQNLRAIALAV